MAIINLPPAQTVEQKASSKKAKIIRNNTQLLNQIINIVGENYQEVWQDPDQVNFSPQNVFNLFGSDAGALVANFQAISTLVNSALAHAGLPAGLPSQTPSPLTINQDGSVTVGRDS